MVRTTASHAVAHASEVAAPDSKTVMRPRAGTETREKLLRAGLKVVGRHGYAGASVSRIATQAGVAQGTLYTYFTSHRDILDQLLPEEGRRMMASVAEATRLSAGYFDMERRGFIAVNDYMVARPYFLRLLVEAEVAAPASFASHMRNVEDRYVGSLERAARAGEITGQSEPAFRAIAEILAGARGHIAIGFMGRDAKAKKPARLPDWAADTYCKFIRQGFSTQPSAIVRKAAPRMGRDLLAPASPTMNALLEAFSVILHAQGFAATTIQAVTCQAGFAVGTFYNHFSSRQDLLVRLLERMRELLRAWVNETVGDSGCFAHAEHASFTAFFDFLTVYPAFLSIESTAAVWSPDAYREHFFALSHDLVAAMTSRKAAGDLVDYELHELPLLAYLLLAARHYLAVRVVSAGSAPSPLPPDITRAYRQLLHSGLQRAP